MTNIEELLLEAAALRKALEVQWEYNHDEHCGKQPCDYGRTCAWPLPVELGGDTDLYRTYDPNDEASYR